MKILFVYQFCTMGGVETVLRNRLKELTKMDIEFDILFLHDFGGKNIFNDFLSSVYITNDNNKIIDLMERERYDCIVNIDTPQIFEILKMISYRPIVVLEVHTTYKENLEYLNKISDISSVIVPSNYMVSLIKNRIKEIPIRVIPNSIDERFLRDKNIYVPTIKKIIGWVGRLDYLKNWEEFICISKHLKSIDNNFEYWIVGGIAAPENVKKDFFHKIKSAGILSNIRWFPKIEFSLMPNYYEMVSKSGGCFVSTSTDESFGMTILESMASKCPVVAPDVGGITELLDKECGILYPSGNTEQVALLIYKLTNDIQLRETIVDNAYKNVLQNYRPEKVVNDWFGLIKSYMK